MQTALAAQRNWLIATVALTLSLVACGDVETSSSDFSLAVTIPAKADILGPQETTTYSGTVTYGADLVSQQITLTVSTVNGAATFANGSTSMSWSGSSSGSASFEVSYTAPATGNGDAITVRANASKASSSATAVIAISLLEDPTTEEDDSTTTVTPTASCSDYVDHYNSLSCTTESLNEDSTCSESISENCTGDDAFNACRIENTSCDGDVLVQNVEGCFELLDCG